MRGLPNSALWKAWWRSRADQPMRRPRPDGHRGRPEHPWAGRADLAPGDLSAANGCSASPVRHAIGLRASLEVSRARRQPARRTGAALQRSGPGAVEREWRRRAFASVGGAEPRAGLLHQSGSPLPERAFHALRHRERSLSKAAEACWRSSPAVSCRREEAATEFCRLITSRTRIAEIPISGILQKGERDGSKNTPSRLATILMLSSRRGRPRSLRESPRCHRAGLRC